jgi:O-antigen ligase
VSAKKNDVWFQAWTLSVLGVVTALYFIVTHDWEIYAEKLALATTIGHALQSPLPAIPAEHLHPNVVGGILAMLAPFAGAAAVISHQRRNTWALAFGSLALILILFGLFLTTARSAWLALGIACIFVGWWFLSRWLTKNRPEKQRYWLFGASLILLLVIVFLLLIQPSARAAIVRIPLASESGLQRADLYANSLTLAADYPLIGAGLDGFMMLYSTYALLTHVGFITHSHNLYVDIVIEQGVIALMSLVWMWLLMGEAVWQASGASSEKFRQRQSPKSERMANKSQADRKRRRRNKTSSRKIVLVAAFMSLIVLLVHGLVDDAIYNSRAVLIFFVPLAFAAPVLKRSTVPINRSQWSFAAIALLLVLVFSVIFWRPLISRVQSNLAAVRQSKAELSHYRWPDNPIQDAVRREVDMNSTIADYKKALSLDPSNASANRRLGQIYLSLGQYDDALPFLLLAYQNTPWDNATRQLLGEALILNGRLDEGVKLWSTVNVDQDQLNLRRYWYQYLGDESRQDAIQQAILLAQNKSGSG